MIKRLERILKKYDKEDGFSGSVLVSKSGEEFFSYYCGYENIPYKIKNSPKTIFPTASATKIFTAVSILKLVEEGKVNLNSKVIDVLKLDDSKISEKVTVENLLNHTSGIDDYFDEYDENCIENLWGRVPNSSIKEIEDLVPYFIYKDPKFQVGEKFEYCNANYVLLGLIIEKISNMKYKDFIRKFIFQDCDMIDSDFISLDSTKRFAEAYYPIYDDKEMIIEWKRNIYMVPFCGSPDGGAYTDGKDIDKFFYKLRKGEILSGKYLDILLNPSFISEDNSFNEIWKYNLGLWFNVKDRKIISYGVTGGDIGVSVKVFYYKDKDILVTILGNKDNSSNELSDEIRRLII